MSMRKTNQQGMPGDVMLHVADDCGLPMKLGEYTSNDVLEDFEFYSERGFSCAMDNTDAGVMLHVVFRNDDVHFEC